MAGNVFMADGIHEYIIYPSAAAQLARGAPTVQIHYVGGDPARIFTRDELLNALRNTKEFDQLESV